MEAAAERSDAVAVVRSALLGFTLLTDEASRRALYEICCEGNVRAPAPVTDSNNDTDV